MTKVGSLLALLLVAPGCITSSSALDDLLARCPSLTPAGFAALNPQQSIFFASWCAPCEDKLAARYKEETVFIGTFDSQENIARVFARSGSIYRCYYDEDSKIAEAYEVDSVPTTLQR